MRRRSWDAKSLPAKRKEPNDGRDDLRGGPTQKHWLDVGSAPPIVRCQSTPQKACCGRQHQPSRPDRVGEAPACQDSAGFDHAFGGCSPAFDIEDRKRGPAFEHVINRVESGRRHAAIRQIQISGSRGGYLSCSIQTKARPMSPGGLPTSGAKTAISTLSTGLPHLTCFFNIAYTAPGPRGYQGFHDRVSRSIP